MALFDDAWMKAFQKQWNAEPGLYEALGTINFDSVIGYGFPNDATCTGFITVKNGHCTEAGAYDGRALNWDMRAKEKNWNNWLSSRVGMSGLGLAFSSGKLEFKKGDFKAMVTDPRVACPFIKSFGAMGRV